MHSVSDAQLFDIENVKRYQRNIWDKSYREGLYFSAMEELGEPIYINFGIRKHEYTELRWFKVPHAIHDGFSALKVLEKEENFSLNLPELKSLKPKNWLKSILFALKSTPVEEHRYKSQDANVKGTSFDHLVLKLPLKSSKLSSTAILSNLICKTLMQELSYNKVARWMVPVRLKNDDGMQASYIGLDVSLEDNENTLHKKLKDKLKNGEHWGFYFFSKIGLFLGKKAILNLTRKSILNTKTIWMGSISNLGNLGESKELEDLIVLHPVRFHRPLGVIVYEFNNQQIITICFHKSLKEVDTDGIRDKVRSMYETY